MKSNYLDDDAWGRLLPRSPVLTTGRCDADCGGKKYEQDHIGPRELLQDDVRPAVATRGSEAAEEAVVALQQAAKLNRMDGLKRKIYRKLLSLHGFHHHVKGFPEHVPFNQFWPTCLAIQRSSESSDQKDHPNGPGSCDVVTCISVRVKLRYSPSLGWFMKENCQIRVSSDEFWSIVIKHLPADLDVTWL